MARVTKSVLAAGSLCFALAASGCYAAAVGLVVGVLSLTDGSGTGDANDPPSPPGIKVTDRWSGDHVRVTYILLDDDGGPLDVEVEWQPEDESLPFAAATEHLGAVSNQAGTWIESDGTRGLIVEPKKPREATFVWAARSDLLERTGRRVGRARLRVTSMGGSDGLVVHQGRLRVDEAPPGGT